MRPTDSDGGKFLQSSRVFPPTVLVEVSGEKETRLVLDHRVDTGHKRLSGVVTAGQVPPNYIVGGGKEAAVRAIRTLDSWFLADAADPLVRTCRGVSGLPCSPALEAARIDLIASSKERTKQRDLGVR